MAFFLGMEFMYSKKGIILDQLKYELELLKRFDLLSRKAIVTPLEINHKLDSDSEGDDVDALTFKQLVGSLRCYGCMSSYLASEFTTGSEDQGNNISEINNIKSVLGAKFSIKDLENLKLIQYMLKPIAVHMHATMQILKYVKNGPTLGMFFRSNSGLTLTRFLDSKMGSCPITRISTPGFTFFMGSILIS
ncbi:uncharacterized protein LOC127104194 [Lathyrus oleraceus]|uniref:uncharacterized protein LOC127104194 n=1 Tax=Pisum sativum TaxID=3888 RepID=UPI0021CE9254|nr:uncharacterized protein LOC127104194 [Pisum sativum]